MVVAPVATTMRHMKRPRPIVSGVLLLAGLWFAWPAMLDLIFDEPALEVWLVDWQGTPRRVANFAVVMICIAPAVAVWAFTRSILRQSGSD
jgi:hypothetical protein